MANCNYACFRCRRSFRQGLRCPSCRQPLDYLGTKWRAPARIDLRAWAEASRAHDRWLASTNWVGHRQRIALETRQQVTDEIRRLQLKRSLTPGDQARLAVLLWHDGQAR